MATLWWVLVPLTKKAKPDLQGCVESRNKFEFIFKLC